MSAIYGDAEEERKVIGRIYHLISMQGEVGEAKLNYIVRDHDKAGFEERKKTLRLIEKNLNEKWGEGTVTLKITDQYRNMKEIVEEHMHLIDHAKKSMRDSRCNAACSSNSWRYRWLPVEF